MFSFRKGPLPDAFNETFLLTNQIHHYIILDTPMPFTHFLVEQISDSLQYAFVDPNCLILSIQKFRMLTVFLNLSLN